MFRKLCVLSLLLMCILMLHTAQAIANPASEFAYVVFEDHVKIIGYEGTNPIVEIPATIGGKPVTYVRLGNTQYESTNHFLGVRKIILPSTVTELGECAFGYYTQLESIEGLEYIERITGGSIFTFCGVKEAHFSTRLKEVASDAFNDSGSLLHVTLPDDAEYGVRSLTLSGVQELTLLRGDGEPTIKLVDGAIYSADGKRLMAVLPLMQSTYYTIADGTETINAGAFGTAIFMEELEIPESVIHMPTYAGGMYLLDHDVTVYVHQDSYAHTFLKEFMEQYPSDADNLIVIVLENNAEVSLAERVQQILAETINDGMSDIQKARALHDWLCEKGSYDYTLSKFSASDILLDGSGVCDAYTRAYCVLLNAAGIESRRISCFLNNAGHAINAIRIDGEWSYTDVTNDDEGFGHPADLFGFNDDVYNAFYVGNTGLQADTLAYYAPYASGELDEPLAVLKEQIYAKLAGGVTNFTVSLDSAPNEIRAAALCSLLEQEKWLYEGESFSLVCTTENNVDFSCYLNGAAQIPEFEYYNNGRGNLTISGYNGCAERVVIPETIDGVAVDAIGNSAFSKNRNVKCVVLPDGVVEILYHAFKDCTALEEINFPASLEIIGDSAFSNCISLKAELNFASGLKKIGEYAFSMCYNVRKASIPGTVSSLGNGVFNQCSMLSNVMLGEGIEVLPRVMFFRCLSLHRLTLPDSLVAIEEGAFSQSNVTSLDIPAKVTNIHWGAFAHAERLASLTVSADNEVYASRDNMLFSKDMKILIASTLGIEASPVIPSSVETIGSYAFIQNDSLRSIRIPSNVKEIEAYAFSNSGLTNVYIEDGVEIIGKQAFDNLNIYVGNICYTGGIDLVSMRLPNTLREIGEGALCGYHPFMNALILPSSLTRIDVQIINASRHLYIPESIVYIAPQEIEYDWYEMVIHGVPGSYAEEFAAEYGYRFVSTVDSLVLGESSIVMLEKASRHLTIETLKGEDASDYADEIVWTSSDECVSVDNGIITAHEMGNAVVTASWNGISASCEVTVGRLKSLGKMSYAGFGDTVLRINESRSMTLYGSVTMLQQVNGEWQEVTKSMDLNAHGQWSVSDPSVMQLTEAIRSGGINVNLLAVGPGVCTVTAVFPMGQSASFDWIVAGAQYVDPADCEHAIVTDEAVAPTCRQEGLTEGSHCEICGTIKVAQEIVDAIGHTEVINAAIAPTCTETGLTEGKSCSVCDEVLVAQEVVDALGHIPSVTQRIYEGSVGGETYVSFTCLCGHNEASLVKWESENPDIAMYVGAPDHADPGRITATFAGMSAGITTVTADFVDDMTEDCVFTIIVHSDDQMILPAMLKALDEEAFMNAPVQEVILPEDMTVIGERAFADCAELAIIHMPDSIASIADNAFAGCENVTFICTSENVAATYAAEHGIPYVIVQ